MKLVEHWYRASPWLWVLWPLSLLFCSLAGLRRLAYRRGWLSVWQPPVPLIIVGNITVGGSGKTPLVLWLARMLREQGYRPGLVSRGYGGKAANWPQPVNADSDPKMVGDEAVLLAGRSGCPMVVGPDRVAAAQQLLAEYDVNVILSDDGMQHYRMGRSLEIAVLDGERRLGNGLCLPAGPLRELPRRLRQVDFIVVNGQGRAGEWSMRLQPVELENLAEGQRHPLTALAGEAVHAVAGIGHPQRFFATLRELGLKIVEHPFPDHHPYVAGELDFADGRAVLMTEKDAVKYRPHATSQHWYLPVQAQLAAEFADELLAMLEKDDGQKTA